MATAQQIEDLLAAVAAVNQTMADLGVARDVLQGYRAERVRYAALVDEQKVKVDAMVASSETALRDIAAKIKTVFP